MRHVFTVLLSILDPISSVITKRFPQKIHNFISKHLIVQIIVALLITLLIIAIVR
ncbi:MAG: hypothetical protein R3Y05_02240 [bacterium]